jgi:hypothetical protein
MPNENMGCRLRTGSKYRQKKAAEIRQLFL